jgi:putative methionine-R-sulfoxide reductase with GAF domain
MAIQSSPLSIFQDVPRSRDRRRSVRQKVHSPAYASFDGIGGGMVLDLTEITDISEAGLSLQAPSVLTPNRALNLVLDLSETKTYINTTGYVVWTDGSGRAGIRFSKMPDSTRYQLKQWLFFNLMAGAAKARSMENESEPQPSEPEVLAHDAYHPSPLDADAMAALSRPAFDTDTPVFVADAPTLNAIQEQVDAFGSDTVGALNLLVERAQAITRAAGCAIALSEGTDMVCRASSGEAPPVGARFQVGSGFSGECVRTAQLQRCDDAESNSIVDRESCRQLGIRSMVAVPVLSGGKVVGLLEVFSPLPFAFEEGDATALRRICDIIARIAETQNRKIQLLAELATSPHADQLKFVRQPFGLQKRWIAVAAGGLTAFIILGLMVYWLLHRSSAPASSPAPAGAQIEAIPPVARDITSLDSLRKYASQGDPVAQFTLGAHYAQGDGVKQDYSEAVRWFSKAAEEGHVVAQATLGAYYWAGRGVPQDLAKAYFWSALARAGGDEASKYRVAALTSRMTRAQVAAAQQEAEEWLRQHSASRAAR